MPKLPKTDQSASRSDEFHMFEYLKKYFKACLVKNTIQNHLKNI